MTFISVKDIAQQARNFTVYEQIEIGLQYALKETSSANDLTQARAWFWVAATYYDSFLAQYYWGVTWQNFQATDFPEQIDLDDLKTLATEGSLAAVYMLGVFYENEDINLAVEYYQHAAQRDFYPALNNLADKYEHGLGVIQDIQQAIKMYSIAAEHEIAAAQWSLAELYFNAVWVEYDEALARHWLTCADQNGWAGAEDRLISMQRSSSYS